MSSIELGLQAPEIDYKQKLEGFNLPRGAQRFLSYNIFDSIYGSRIKKIIDSGKDKVLDFWDNCVTAGHEIMHRLVGLDGGSVLATNIIPDGGRKGLTIVSADPSLSYVDQLRYYIGSFCGGLYGERKLDHHDHRGCGYDMGMVENLAKEAAIISRGKFSVGQLISEGMRTASNKSSSTSDSDFNAYTLDLAIKGSI